MIKKLLKSLKIPTGLLVYGASQCISKLSIFLILPLITNQINAQEYGKWVTYNTLCLSILPLTGLMLSDDLMKRYFDKSIHFEKYLSNALVLFLSTSITIYIILTLNDFNIFDLPSNSILLIPLYLFLLNIRDIYFVLLRLRKKTYSFLIRENAYTVLPLLTCLVILYSFNTNWYSLLYAYIGIYLILGLIQIIEIYRQYNIQLKLNYNYFKQSIRETTPLIGHTISGIIIASSDKFLIQHYLGHKSVGLYAIAYLLGSLPLLITYPFNKVWGPYAFEKIRYQKYNNELKRYLYTFIISLFPVGLITIFCSYFYIFNFLKGYEESFPLVVIITFGIILQSIQSVAFVYFNFYNKSHVLSLITTLSAVINIVTNIIFIPLYGLVAACYTTVLSYFIMTVLTYLYIFIYEKKRVSNA